MIGWLSIIIFGLLYNKRIPGFLVARKGVSITHLFRFMFGLGIDIQSIRKKSLKLVSKKRPKFADTTKSEQDTLNVHKIVSSYCEPEIAVAEDKQDLDIDFVEDSRFDDKLSNINRDLDRSYATIRYETEEIPNSDRMMTV